MSRLARIDATSFGTPRRLEVRTGPARRREHSDAEKAALVARSLAPDVCIADIARENGLHPQQLYTWRRQAKRGELVLPADAMPMFAEVVAVPEPASPTSAPREAAGGEDVVIELGDLRLRIGSDVPPSRVAELVAALRAST